MPIPSPANNAQAFNGAAGVDPLPVYPEVSFFTLGQAGSSPLFQVNFSWGMPSPLRPDIHPTNPFVIRRATGTTPPASPSDGSAVFDGSGTAGAQFPVLANTYTYAIWVRYQTTLGEIFSKRVSATIVVA